MIFLTGTFGVVPRCCAIDIKPKPYVELPSTWTNITCQACLNSGAAPFVVSVNCVARYSRPLRGVTQRRSCPFVFWLLALVSGSMSDMVSVYSLARCYRYQGIDQGALSVERVTSCSFLFYLSSHVCSSHSFSSPSPFSSPFFPTAAPQLATASYQQQRHFLDFRKAPALEKTGQAMFSIFSSLESV